MTRAELQENLLVAVDTIRSHKGRSVLTVIGIVIGVTSVISVAAIIEGLNRFIQAKVDSLGSRTFFISRFPAGQDPSRMALKYRIRKYLDYSDADYLRRTCPGIETATTFGTRAFFLGENNSIGYQAQRVERVFVRGAEPEYVNAIPAFTIGQAGSFLRTTRNTRGRGGAWLGDRRLAFSAR